MVLIRSAALSDTGFKRPNNEDFIAKFEPSDPLELLASGCLYIVADGVGGSAQGERASRYAAEKLLYEYFRRTNQPPARRLVDILQEAGNEIFNHAADTEGQPHMATTLVAAVVQETALTVANIGDSRAYLIRDGSAMQITRDHTELEEISAGQISADATRHPGKITRSVGGEPDPLVDIYSGIQLRVGDRILLCSDGLTRYARAEDIARLAGARELDAAVSSLVQFANQSGGADNVSVVLVEVDR